MATNINIPVSVRYAVAKSRQDDSTSPVPVPRAALRAVKRAIRRQKKGAPPARQNVGPCPPAPERQFNLSEEGLVILIRNSSFLVTSADNVNRWVTLQKGATGIMMAPGNPCSVMFAGVGVVSVYPASLRDASSQAEDPEA